MSHLIIYKQRKAAQGKAGVVMGYAISLFLEAYSSHLDLIEIRKHVFIPETNLIISQLILPYC